MRCARKTTRFLVRNGTVICPGPAVRIKRSEIDAVKRHGDLSSGHDFPETARLRILQFIEAATGGKPFSNKDGGDWMAFWAWPRGMCVNNAAVARNTKSIQAASSIVGLSDNFGHRRIRRTDFYRMVGALVRARLAHRFWPGQAPSLGGALGRTARRMLAGERDCGTNSAVCAEGRL